MGESWVKYRTTSPDHFPDECTKGALVSMMKLPRSLGRLQNQKGGRCVLGARQWCRGCQGVAALCVNVPVSIFAICVGLGC